MKTQIILKELEFKATRSSGAGGQHVNKVSSKVMVRLNIKNSKGLTHQEKDKIGLKLSSRISKEGFLQIGCDTSRNQHRNKNLGIQRLLEILRTALISDAVRIATKPSRSSVSKRLDNKKKHAQKKNNRRNLDF
ncbi:alternative ribosome rescue aminoacyl-tRNA hydrolase ArfB [Aquimarina sp. W85]|uniref:alternative ribosome rescue aminoacyl-tRNA hydrolase ArfB n=1 Tax=Aquimarina rhodophyticola TaxID=3342246 RepID=UPI00366ED49D